MTAQGLLLLILLGIFIQLAVYSGVAFFRHWLAFQALSGQPASPRLEAAVRETGPVTPAWQGYRDFKVVDRQVEDAAGSVCSFYLAPVDGQPLPGFLPGQFLGFRLDVPGQAKPVVRCYSLSDKAESGYYRVSIKRVAPSRPDLPAGLVSNHFHDRVRKGDVLAVKAPSGHFYLDVDAEGPVVLVAGGIGITPVYSMLRAALAARPEREIWLFYSVRDGSEMVMREALAELADRHAGFHLHVCFSRPGSDDVVGRDFRHVGRADIGRLRQELKLQPYHFYVCGPAPMMETLVPDLADWGVPPARIHFESFGPATVARRPGATATESSFGVTFSASDRRVDWQAGSLLELAEAHGIAVESGCRSGCCGACQTTIVSGEVTYAQAPEFDVEPGRCLLCLAQPHSELVLAA